MTSCWGLYARGVLGVLHCSWRHLWQFQNRGSNLTFTEKNGQKCRSRTFTSNHGNIWWPFWWNMCCKPSPKSALLQDVFFSDGQELVLTCNLDSSWDQKLREPGEHLKSFEIIWNHLKSFEIPWWEPGSSSPSSPWIIGYYSNLQLLFNPNEPGGRTRREWPLRLPPSWSGTWWNFVEFFQDLMIFTGNPHWKIYIWIIYD